MHGRERELGLYRMDGMEFYGRFFFCFWFPFMVYNDTLIFFKLRFSSSSFDLLVRWSGGFEWGCIFGKRVKYIY